MVKRSLALFFGLFLLAGIMGAPGLARADWTPGDPYKWLQSPDLTPTGVDVKVVNPYPAVPGLADDFQCTGSGPISDIHIWGSFSNDTLPPTQTFLLSIWSNNSGGSYSTPATLLWSQVFFPGQYTSRLYDTVSPQEYFYNPATGQVGFDTKVYQFNFYPTNPFVQTLGTIYWLGLSTDSDYFGWKSRDYNEGQFMDDAVWYDAQTFTWQNLEYFPGHPYVGQSMDLSFVLTPIPGSVWLMGSGLLGLSGIIFRRRRRK